MSSARPAFALLPAYITSETTRASLSFAAVHSKVQISPTVITLSSEALKLLIALAFLYWRQESRDAHSLKTAILFASGEKASWKTYGAFAVPAILYLVNNLLYLIALQFTSPSLLHVAILAKLPLTGILHHVLVRRQKNVFAWTSVVVLCFGLAILNAPINVEDIFHTKVDDSSLQKSTSPNSLFLGPLIGVVIATFSSLAGVFTEIVLKQDVAFWVAQFWLYMYGTLFAGIIFVFWDGSLERNDRPLAASWLQSLPWDVAVYLSIILATALTGLIVANILRRGDNLVNLVGTSASIVTITIVQVAFFPDLRKRTIRMHTTLGLGIIAVSTWTYNYYKGVRNDQEKTSNFDACYEHFVDDGDAESVDYLDDASDDQTRKSTEGFELKQGPVGAGEALEEEPARHSLGSNYDDSAGGNILKPDWRKVTTASLLVVLLTYLTSLYRHSLSSAMAGVTAYNDMNRFFTPRNIMPASWQDTINPVNCVRDWMDREGIHPRSAKFFYWEQLHPLSDCPVYPIPDGGLLFHIYWNGPWRPFNEVPIEGFLATQRLGDGHKLIYWYENGAPSIETRLRFSQYSKFVEFRRFDRTIEAPGTCLASMPEYTDQEYQNQMGMPQSTRSDLVRILLLARYGGVWMDADVVPLRDMTPLLRSGPSWPYLWDDRSNNHLLIFGPPTEGGVGARVLETACTMSYNQTLFRQRYPDLTFYDQTWIYNDGLAKLCQTVANCGISRNHVWFLDGLTFLGPGQEDSLEYRCNDLGDQDTDGRPAIPASVHALWTAHMRLDKMEDDCIADKANTIAASMRRRMKGMLELGLDMDGRAIYPGPGYLTE